MRQPQTNTDLQQLLQLAQAQQAFEAPQAQDEKDRATLALHLLGLAQQHEDTKATQAFRETEAQRAAQQFHEQLAQQGQLSQNQLDELKNWHQAQSTASADTLAQQGTTEAAKLKELADWHNIQSRDATQSHAILAIDTLAKAGILNRRAAGSALKDTLPEVGQSILDSADMEDANKVTGYVQQYNALPEKKRTEFVKKAGIPTDLLPAFQKAVAPGSSGGASAPSPLPASTSAPASRQVINQFPVAWGQPPEWQKHVENALNWGVTNPLINVLNLPNLLVNMAAQGISGKDLVNYIPQQEYLQ